MIFAAWCGTTPLEQLATINLAMAIITVVLKCASIY
jgi:hypothetical protein